MSTPAVSSTGVDAAGFPAPPAIPTPVPESGPQAAAPPAATVHSGNDLRRALEALAHRLDPGRTQLNFRVDQDLHQVVISIVDPESGAILRQIPAEEVMRMAQSLQEWMGGLVDETA